MTADNRMPTAREGLKRPRTGRVQAQPRALLRWAGSKRRSITQYQRFLPSEFDCYIEPFAGSADIFFSRKPRRAVLTDLNEALIGTYRFTRSDPVRVCRHYNSYQDTEIDYYAARDEFND